MRADAPGWRWRGQTPSPEAYEAHFWHEILCQFVVVTHSVGRIDGLVLCFNADFQAQHAEIAVIRLSSSSVNFGSGVARFISYLFDMWPFRKLYVRVSELSIGNMTKTLERWGVLEGVLRDYIASGTGGADVYIYSISRDRWIVGRPHRLVCSGL
jgi:hypothetical protein